MRSKFIALIALSLLMNFSCSNPPADNRIVISIPSIDQEASYIWRTINDIEFLENMGYSISLPKDALVDSLVQKSKNKTFSDKDFPAIYQLLESKIYNKEDYEQAYQKVLAQKEVIDQIMQEIEATRTSWDWDFKLYEHYDIVFTLYGSGGSYDPNTGTVTLFTTKDGKFKKYKNPANTIIHEISHLGMESAIVQKWKLPHVVKERIVDQFVYLMFKEQLPTYKVQNMGDTRIDEYLKSKEDFQMLNTSLEEFTKQRN